MDENRRNLLGKGRRSKRSHATLLRDAYTPASKKEEERKKPNVGRRGKEEEARRRGTR